jgi:hypothetical protein
MQKGTIITLLIFSLLIFSLIIFIEWCLINKIFNGNDCNETSQCTIHSIDMNCISDNDCLFEYGQGSCNLNTFKCKEIFFNGIKEDCLAAGGDFSSKKDC